MEITTYIGIAASALTAASLIPQLIKIIREKKAQGISLAMLSVLLAGLSLWIVYGIRKEDWIIIISNSFAVLINLTTGLLALLYKKSPPKK
jgi:MtN3 and saliva related transmembrane protein